MDKIKFINCEGIEIPLSIPVEMDLPKFFNDNNLSPTTQHDLLFFCSNTRTIKKVNG